MTNRIVYRQGDVALKLVDKPTGVSRIVETVNNLTAKAGGFPLPLLPMAWQAREVWLVYW